MLNWSQQFLQHQHQPEPQIIDLSGRLTNMGAAFLKSLGPNATGTLQRFSGRVAQQRLQAVSHDDDDTVTKARRDERSEEPLRPQLLKFGVLTEAQVRSRPESVCGWASHASMIESTPSTTRTREPLPPSVPDESSATSGTRSG